MSETTTPTGPYARAAHHYVRLGYSPLPAHGKKLAVKGWTGGAERMASGADVQAWIEDGHADLNVALRLPTDVLGIDVDAYGGKHGAETLQAWIERHGELPETVRSTSREDGISGVYLYRVPPGLHWRSDLGTGTGVEVVRFGHRYVVAAPSIHPERGVAYRWWRGQAPLGAADLPRTSELPELPERWVTALRREPAVRPEAPPYAGSVPDTIVPEAAVLRDDVLALLDECRRLATEDPGRYTGPAWEQSTWLAAIGLAELAASPWSGYSAEQGAADLREHAPTDAGWTLADVAAKWQYALGRAKALPAPPGSGEIDPFSPYAAALLGAGEGQHLDGQHLDGQHHEDQHHEGHDAAEREEATGAPGQVEVAAAQHEGSADGAGQTPGAPEGTDTTARVEHVSVSTSAVRIVRPGETGWMGDANLSALVVHECLAGRFIWAEGLGWLRWDSRRWAMCSDTRPLEAVRRYLTNLYGAQVVRGGDPKALGKLLSAGTCSAVLRLSMGQLVRSAADFDAHPDLLNVHNGVIDLRTGELIDHDPALLLTKITPTRYDPGAEHEDWERAKEALPPDVLDYMQVRLGQAATGYPPPDDVLPICVGGGENGKSAVLGVAARVLGEHAILLSDRVLMGDAGHPTEFMDLRGARLALIEETPEARHLNVARLKKVVGTPTIRAHYMRQDNVEFTATHSLVVTSNYRPLIEETDHGTWRRLALVTFPYTFVKPGRALSGADDKHGDPGLKDRLLPPVRNRQAASHPAVLRWLVEGAMRFYAARALAEEHRGTEHLSIMAPPPARVAEDTYAWRIESDLVLGYIHERIIFDATSRVIASELVEDFNEWVAARGHRPWAARTFYARFEGHDETRPHRVGRKRVRAGSMHLSRRHDGDPYSGSVASLPPAGPFWAVENIRFRVDADDDVAPFVSAV